MSYLTLNGFVLHTLPSGEVNRLLRLLTKDHGLLRVMARGAARSKSPLCSLSTPFVFIEANIFCYRDYYTLDGASLIEPFLALREDVTKLTCAVHLAEVFQDALWAGLVSPDAYELWAYAAYELSSKDDAFLITHIAQLRLLSIIGYEPWIVDCIHCHHPIEYPARFSLADSGLFCPHCQPQNDAQILSLDAETASYLHFLISAPLNRILMHSCLR